MLKQRIQSLIGRILLACGAYVEKEVIHEVRVRTERTSFKPFYIHKQTHVAHGKYKGFSAYIEPAEDQRKVLIKITYCSKKDEFCKRKAREQLARMESKEINSRAIVRELDKAWYTCLDAALPTYGEQWSGFNYVMRYVI